MSDEQSSQDSATQQWQQDVINRLAFAALNEQKKSRRWKIFFVLLFFSYLFLVYFTTFVPTESARGSIISKKHTALIEVNGVIADDQSASADNIVTGLRNAFQNEKVSGIILRINSPGGSPVQSGYVYDEIARLREQYPNTKVYAVITDIGASGGYYIAAGADEIYADKASLVGSIGVIMNSFGFTEAIDKLGVERRLYTAGESKGFLDPFTPEKQEEVQHVKGMLNNIHQQFIETVKQGRGDRLSDDPEIFSGLIWTGEESLELGLIDGLGSSSYVAREVIEAENIVDYTPQPDFFERFTRQLGAAMAGTMSKTLGLEGGRIR
ncbi:signal peptide peptidase SppA [Thiohalophilus thiocyanatoxydans]|nr:signal peptide peptidase SppA [Thiohalophilus thiocyanatoxydans]